MLRSIRRALISVSDKTGLLPFARFLSEQGVELLSTGGTAKTLRDAGLAVKDVSEHTGFPEMLDGRVKTLHPMIHGGLLGRRDLPAHREAMEAHRIAPIDLLIVNLYPFEETVARGAAAEDCIENIDIGGPGMIRSAAKNHEDVAVLVDPADYARIEQELHDHKGATTLELRRELAAKAFTRTASYDMAIANWFAAHSGDAFPQTLLVRAERRQALRYGENPHQQAAFYAVGASTPGIAGAAQLQGKELSYNNINDTDAAFELVSEFTSHAAVAIIKHANPCGVAVGGTAEEAFRKALACDPVSAYGGILALNRPLDVALVEALGALFLEVIIAPDASPEAKELLAKKKNLRLLVTGAMPDAGAPGVTLRSVSGGILAQTRDAALLDASNLRCVTRRAPSQAETDAMHFAFTVAKHVKSNAIVLARDGATIGIGAGQMSRIDSTRIAGWKAAEARLATEGAVLASDAFFPFADNVERAAEMGIRAIIQPGGSIRDEEVIAAADAHGMAMLFTGMRHFRH